MENYLYPTKKKSKILFIVCSLCCIHHFCLAQNIIFPSDAGVLNVKNPPFNAVGDGVTDDTRAILDALDSATIDYRYINMTVYIPNGTYLVSNQIEYPTNGNIVTMLVQVQGQSEQGTIIKLKNSCVGFTNIALPKAVINTGCCSENAFRNSLRNLTINTGVGNVGACGLNYFASNAGICENVSIISGDGSGVQGLILPANVGPCMVKNVSVNGFDIGIYSKWGNHTTLENINLNNQNVYGFLSEGGRNAFRKLTSTNAVTAIHCTGGEGETTLMDCNFIGTNVAVPAIFCASRMYVRNVNTNGYSTGIEKSGGGCANNVPIGNIAEWNYNCAYSTLFDIGNSNFNLPVLETPSVPWDQNFANWANVVTFGADPYGIQDCTAAVQAAINSGATTVYFPTGANYRYRINGVVRIKGNVSRIIGCEATFEVASGKFQLIDTVNAPNTVVMERFSSILNTNPFAIEQASTNRTLVLKSLLDINILSSATGNLFIEDMTGRLYPNKVGANIWARQLNNENNTIYNNGAKLWILGMKVEANDFTWINTRFGGTTELLGFLDYHSIGGVLTVPQFINEESTVQILPSIYLSFGCCAYPVSVKETQGGVAKDLTGVGWSGYYYKGRAAIPNAVIWIGNTSKEWTTASNWSTNYVPTIADVVIIPSNTTYSPETNTVQSLRNLILHNGAQLTLANGLNIVGNCTINGTINGLGIINLNGNTSQTLSGNGIINKVTLNSGTNVSVATGSNLIFK
jgi:Pectate lyase superfamily protein